jgi:nucleoid DNA-binding protein
MKFTEEEIKKQFLDPRKLKTTRAREKYPSINLGDLIRKTSKDTGYQVKSVKLVLESMFQSIDELLLSGNQVQIGRIGFIAPVLTRAKKVNNFNRYGSKKVTPMLIGPQFNIKLFPSETFVQEVKNIEVNLEDIERLYK